MPETPRATTGPGAHGRRPKTLRKRIGRWTRPVHAPLVPFFGGGLFAVLRRLPLWTVRPLAGFLGRVAFLIVRPVISKRVLANYEYAFGDRMTPRERKVLLKRAYVGQAVCLLEAMALSRDPKLVYERIVNWEEIRQQLTEILRAGRGLVFLSAHIGSWELLGLAIGASFPLTTVAGRPRNEAANRLLVRIRESQGGRIVFTDEPPRKLLRALKDGEIVGIVADRSPRKVSGMETPFFGHTTKMPTAPYVLALKTGAPMVFVLTMRQPDGTYVMHLAGPIQLESTGERDADVSRGLALWTAFLEERLREAPESWLPLSGHWKQEQET